MQLFEVPQLKSRFLLNLPDPFPGYTQKFSRFLQGQGALAEQTEAKGNENFDREEIARAHREVTIRRMIEYGGTVLAVQDTTGVTYNTHLKTEGIRVYQ
jgi:hypothetical protein